VISTLDTTPVVGVLAELRTYAAVEDAAARQRVAARAAELGAPVPTAEKYELYGAAPPLAVSAAVGELLYLITLARRPRRVVEFGSSHGISTIYLAAALRDAGRGTLVTTEIVPEKAEATARNLAEAGLGDLVELRAGDARSTLGDIAGAVELVFLDGRNDLYLPILELLEPALADDAVIAADLSPGDPDLDPYLAHVRDPGGHYRSRLVPLDGGLELSLHAGDGRQLVDFDP
jgi:predicted O-methyltransferase YrrM